MRHWNKITLTAAVGLIVAGIAGIAYGQMRGPGGPGGMMPPSPPPAATQVAYGAHALFVLSGPTLVKLDGATLKTLGTLTLGEKPAAPTEGQRLQGPPPGGGVLLTTDTTVLAVVGKTFYRINAADMTIALKKALPEPQAPNAPAMNDQQQGPPPRPAGPPAFTLQGGTLYLVRGPQALAINIATGEAVTGSVPVPQPPAQGGAMGRPMPPDAE